MLGQGFQNGTHIADRHLLFKQILQHFMQRGEGHYTRHQIFRQLRHLLGDAVKQLLRLLAAEQLGRELANQVVKMGCHNGTGFHHGVSLNLRLLFQGALNPDCRQAKRRVSGLLPWQRPRRRAWVNGQPAPRISITTANLNPFHQDTVASRWQIHIVADMHYRRQEAHILGKLLTNTANTPQQLTVLLEINHRDKAVTHLHTQRVFQLNIIPGRFNRLAVLRHFHRRRLRLRFGFTSAQPPRQPQQRTGEEQEDKVRHARYQTQQTQNGGAQQHHARVAEQLANHLLTHILVSSHAGNDNARGGRDNQRRDLCYQAVTNGQQRITFGGMPHIHTVLQNPDQQAPHHVDHHDQDPRDGIATHELTRPVHRAVEVRFLGHFRTTFFRFIFGDQPGVQVGVDRHLFARHSVQHETRAHFGDTSRTFGNNHKVDDNEDHEHHDADGEVAAHQEVAKGFHHFTRCRSPRMAIHQDDTG